MAVNKKALQVLAQISDEFDHEGYTEEANVIDQITESIVEDLLEQEAEGQGRVITAIGKGTAKALKTLHTNVSRFNAKDIDTRGENGAQLRECKNLADQLEKCLEELLDGISDDD